MKKYSFLLLLATMITGCSALKSPATSATQQTASSTSTSTAVVPKAKTNTTATKTETKTTEAQKQTVRKLTATAEKLFGAQVGSIPSFNASRIMATMGKMTVNASAKYIQDSALIVSVQFMGFEAARLEMTNKELRGIDKLHKQYFVSTYEELNNQYSVPFQLTNAIDLVMGRIFLLGNKTIDPQHEAFSTLQSGTTKNGYAVFWTVGKVDQRFDADSTLHINKTRLAREKEEIYVLYSNWENTQPAFPRNIQLISQGTNRASISLAIQRISFETPNLQFQDLSKYKRITLDQLMNEYLK